MYYGYNFTQSNPGGLGALIHDVMLAKNYAEQNNYTFCFTSEGYEIQRLNGSIDDDIDTPNKCWHSYFNSIPIINTNRCIDVWPNFVSETKNDKLNINDFSNLVKNTICVFNDHVKKEINELVKKTPFNKETDIVLHVRRTDKYKECTFMPIETYIRECEFIISQIIDFKPRIYICTDDKSICKHIESYFLTKNIKVVWDDKETEIPLHVLRVNCKLTKTEAQKETMDAFKNLFIMKDSKILVGGRMSYFFRIAELLRYPKETINIQDNDKFGIAPYSLQTYPIRPYKKRFINDFLNSFSDIDIQKYYELLQKDNIITISNVISDKCLSALKYEMEKYKWWSYAIMPNNNDWCPNYFNIQDETLIERFIECENILERGCYAYRFKRDIGNHYDTCNCIACSLYDTIGSFPITDFLCKVTGARNMIPGEMFISNYSKGDFLTNHHDKNKGDIAVTFSFTDNWIPEYGGILHFCDDKKNIYKSVVPKLGDVNIFRLKPGLNNHFVSTVNVNKNRYTLLAWYYFVN
jgi:hypothetical protein